jgi:hypothetical protein
MPAAQLGNRSEASTMETAEPCWFCRTERGDQTPPGGWIYDDGTWRAGHIPEGWAPAGTVATATGTIIAAIKEVTNADRVYLWSTMARHPHLHVWLLPWWQDAPKEGPGYLAAMSELNPCTHAEAESTARQLRAALA